MRIFVFKSDANANLRAFAGDLDVSKLPTQVRPWHAIGTIAPGNAPFRISSPANRSRKPSMTKLSTLAYQAEDENLIEASKVFHGWIELEFGRVCFRTDNSRNSLFGDHYLSVRKGDVLVEAPILSPIANSLSLQELRASPPSVWTKGETCSASTIAISLIRCPI
jgi:hypothetical protein